VVGGEYSPDTDGASVESRSGAGQFPVLFYRIVTAVDPTARNLVKRRMGASTANADTAVVHKDTHLGVYLRSSKVVRPDGLGFELPSTRKVTSKRRASLLDPRCEHAELTVKTAIRPDCTMEP